MKKGINFKGAKNTNLIGVLETPNMEVSKIVIVAHGFTSNKDRGRFIKLSKSLAQSGIACFRFDFGGSGESDDRHICLQDEIEDLKSAIELVKSKGFSHIGLMGESLGGLVSLEAYNSKSISSIVLWAPAIMPRDLKPELSPEQKNELESKGYCSREKDGRIFKISRKYLEEKKNIQTDEILGRIDIPVLIIHGSADQTVPLSDSKFAITKLPQGTKLEIIEGWKHGDENMEKMMGVIIPLTINWFLEALD